MVDQRTGSFQTVDSLKLYQDLIYRDPENSSACIFINVGLNLEITQYLQLRKGTHARLFNCFHLQALSRDSQFGEFKRDCNMKNFLMEEHSKEGVLSLWPNRGGGVSQSWRRPKQNI